MDEQERELDESPEVAADETASPGRGPWRFKTFEALWNALEHYHFYDGTIVRQMGEAGHGGAEGQGIILTDEWAEILERNKAIDRAMLRLRAVQPKSYILVDRYFRHGLCESADGWIQAANRAGVSLSRKDHTSRAAFDWMPAQAVELLFVCHRARSKSWIRTWRPPRA